MTSVLPPGAIAGLSHSPRREAVYSLSNRFNPQNQNEHIHKAKVFDQQLVMLEGAFNEMDENKDGFITKAELMKVFQTKWASSNFTN